MRTDAFDVLGAGLSRLRASVPLLLAVPTLLLYWVAGAPLASFPTPWWTWVVLGGALVGSLLYLVLGYVSGLSATPAESHRRNFDDLRSHQDALEETLEVLGEPAKQSPISQLAVKKAGGSLTTVKAALGDARPGEGWATGSRIAPRGWSCIAPRSSCSWCATPGPSSQRPRWTSSAWSGRGSPRGSGTP